MPERLSEAVLLKLTPSELADLDRVRGETPRAVFVKAWMRTIIAALDRDDPGD